MAVSFCVSGIEDAHCDWKEYLSNYPINISDIMMIYGSLGRIRPRDPKSTTCKMRLNIDMWGGGIQ